MGGEARTIAVMRLGGTQTLIAGAMLLLAGCAAVPPPSAEPPCPTPEMTVRKQAKAQAWDRYAYARDHTADGSRAYGYFTYDEFHHPIVALMLVVQPDGSATLTGSVPQPVTLTSSDIAPFEATVLAAGFPDLPTAAPEPGAFCFADQFWRDSFEAARDGRRSAVRGNDCGSLADSVRQAGLAMVALAKAHGGLLDAFADRMQDECPIRVGRVRPMRLR